MTRQKIIITSLLAISIIFSCEDRPISIPDNAFTEFTVDLAGQWKINQVRLNDIDITTQLDFSQLVLNLNMSNQSPSDFTLDGLLTPFIVSKNGSWSYDDPSYPTQIYFNDGTEMKIAHFETPPISNDTQFSIQFSLGCRDNLYTYHFIKLP